MVSQVTPGGVSDEIGLIQSDMTNVSLILGYFQHQSRSSCDKRMIIL